MITKVRKGLHDIVTRDSLADDAKNPQRKFLCVAALELRKAMCERVRDAARKRVAEMDQKIAELEGAKTQLLAPSQVAEQGAANPTAAQRPTRDVASQERRGFALRY